MPEPGSAGRGFTWDRLEAVAVVLVALHSYTVGAMLLFFPAWTLDFAGWGQVDSLFFPRQSGAFHVVVASGYLLEFFHHRGIMLLLAAKSTAVIFLIALNPWATAWSIPFSGIFDGLMLVGMIVLHRRAAAERRRAAGPLPRPAG
jgi:hypothetical protein